MHYSLPHELSVHVKAVFYTCQAMPRIHKHINHPYGYSYKNNYQPNEMKLQNSGEAITVSFIDILYDIPSARGLTVYVIV
jgi:hypothetical protein